MIVNGPARAGTTRVPRHSLRLSTMSRRTASSATNQRAIRRKRGHQNAHTPGRDRIGRKHSRPIARSEEHTSELQSRLHLVCRLLLEKKKENKCATYILIMERIEIKTY